MEKTAKQKLSLGIFVVLSTLILIIALYFIGNRQHLFQKNTILKAQFYNVNGLQMGNNVRFSGIDVGTVSKIDMISDSTIIVEMRIRKENATFIRKNAIASIGSDGLVGNMIVNITPENTSAVLVISGDTLRTSSKIATDDMLSTLSVTNQNAALLTADLLKITTQILEGEGTISLFLNDAQAAQDLKETIAKIKQTSEQASQSMYDINEFSRLLKKEGTVAHTLFADTTSGNSLKNVITNVEFSSENLTAATAQLQQIITSIENSKGTLNYIVNDTLLPKDIEATVREIKQSSERLNENMEALQHNILFRGYFNKLERQARKEAKKESTTKTTKDEN